MTEITQQGPPARARRGDPCTATEECMKPVLGRGWCAKHYYAWQKFGDPLHETRKYVAQTGKCKAPGCTEKPKYDNLCGKHVTRMLAHGSTIPPRERKFWAQVDRRGPGECWPWLGCCQKNGYGQYGSKGERLAHRVAYGLVIGPIPDGLVLDHLCHTADPACADTNECAHRRCVNPEHLEPVTRRENIARGRGGDSWGYQPLPPRPEPVKPTACACGSPKPIYKSGKCRPCYRKWLKDPNVQRPRQMTVEQRFWAKVNKTDTCWLWTASINRGTGYGQFSRRHGEGIDAHRFSYELAHGSIPPGHDVHHICHVRHCVRPAHLSAMLPKQNRAIRLDRRTT